MKETYISLTIWLGELENAKAITQICGTKDSGNDWLSSAVIFEGKLDFLNRVSTTS